MYVSRTLTLVVDCRVGYGLALLGLNLHKEYKKNPDRISGLVTYMLSCGLASSKK
jgi:hypothetical protein